MKDGFADWLANDEWFRLASAPSTYRYDCYVNVCSGVECTVFVAPEVTTVPFPVRILF